MQYILTQEEYEALITDRNNLKRLLDRKTYAEYTAELQKFATLIADNLPISRGGGLPDQVWGCIFTKDYEWYCDNCPAQNICPNQYKDWSK